MILRRAWPLALALALLVGPRTARADLVLFSSEPAYLAPIVDKLVGRELSGGAHRGLLLGQRVAIPDLETPLDEVLAGLAAYDSAGNATFFAIIPARALPGGPAPGDLLVPTWIADGAEGRMIAVEEDRVRGLRLAGAEAGFFEVPDVRAPKRPAVRRPSVVAGGASTRAPGVAGAQNPDAAVADRDGFPTAFALSRLGRPWAIVEPVIGDVGGSLDSTLVARSIDNASRLLLAYAKSIPAPEKPPIPAFPPRPPKGQVALRQSPTADGAVVGYFPRGTRYQVLETLPKDDWQRIRLVGMSGEGWASKLTLEREPLIVYGLGLSGGTEVLTPREYSVDPEFATPTNIARAICSPDDKRLETREIGSVKLCAGIDSMMAFGDSIIVYLGPASKAMFQEGSPQDLERFLAKLVYTLTDNPRFKSVRLTFTEFRGAAVRALRREDFMPYWPSGDLADAAEHHADPDVRSSARLLLYRRH